MAEVDTGLNPFLGLTGAAYAMELVRQASFVTSELSEQPTHGIPRTVDIVRLTEAVAADTAACIEGTWQPVAGLGSLTATLFQGSRRGINGWGEDAPSGPAEVIKGSRVLLIADVPAAGGIADNKILLTDKVRFDDPEFGIVDMAIKEVTPVRGTGLIHVSTVYNRDQAS
jgi:hypothetical protein